MKATLPSAGIAKANVRRVDVGRVAIGPIDVGQLVLEDTSVEIRSGQARLLGLSLGVTLRFDLVWRVRINLPWPFDDIDVGGTDTLGSATIPFPPIDASIPSLRNIDLDVPQLTGSGVRVQADPITDLRLNALEADALRAADVTVPAQDVVLSGLGLTSLGLDAIAVPAAGVGAATIRRLTGAPIALGALRLRNLVLPAAAANDITSAGLDVPFVQDPFELGPLPLGILRVSLRVQPSADAHVDRLRLSGVQLGARVGAIQVRDVRLPYEALNLTLSDIGIQTIDIPSIGVS